jgi:tellurite resistance protein TerC
MTTETQSPPRAAAIKNSWQHRLNKKFGLDKMPRIRKFIYSMVGMTLLLIGLAMTVLPGPAFIVIPVGLAILASEYAWARRILRRGRVFLEKTKRSTRFRRSG